MSLVRVENMNDEFKECLDNLKSQFDSVVMLTWSDWHTESVSNRYHFATRFAKHWPVIFVQPDLLNEGFEYEEVAEVSNLFILHVFQNAVNRDISKILNLALLEKGYIQPILWLYNADYFANFYLTHHSRLKIYHATEDYFLDFYAEPWIDKLKSCLQTTHVLVSVSEEVEKDYLIYGNYKGATILSENGCDYQFYSPSKIELEKFSVVNPIYRSKIIFFQGGIRRIVDFDLLYEVIWKAPEHEFWFCGKVDETIESEWSRIEQMPNVKYYGYVGLNKLRELSYQADVGIIPYIQEEIVTRVSLPLKTFEYMSCGLPVVSVPINSLSKHNDLIFFAENAEEFVAQLNRAAGTRSMPLEINKRLSIAKSKSYDLCFDKVVTGISKNISDRLRDFEKINENKSYNILMLYDDNSIHVQTVKEYLDAFQQYSQHRYTYLPSTGNHQCAIEFAFFDVIMLHYSVRVCFNGHLSLSFETALREYGGLKVLFIQDDYDLTETARSRMQHLGIHMVFTFVPDKFIDVIYPKSRFPYTLFKNMLTGYLPKKLLEKKHFIPLQSRANYIVYRGRLLPYSYGSLCYEKYDIGIQMKCICENKNLPIDIEVVDSKRIYGEKWYSFLESGRATLGTETGSNLFDFDGSVTEAIRRLKEDNPALHFEDVYNEWIFPYESLTDIHELSPKIFEAIAHKTALILFEGEYSGIIFPYQHYIPLKKDYSNVNEVLVLLDDLPFLEELTERAYMDIVMSGKYSYHSFVRSIDSYINKYIFKNTFKPVYGLIGFELSPGMLMSESENSEHRQYFPLSELPEKKFHMVEKKSPAQNSFSDEKINVTFGDVRNSIKYKLLSEIKRTKEKFINFFNEKRKFLELD